MILKIDCVCQICKKETQLHTMDGKLLNKCSHCNEIPLCVKKKEGIIYVIKNDNQKGVKIGFTRKTLTQRMKELNTTGVAGTFRPVAFFISNRPKVDEAKVHQKLKRYLLDKEHFELKPEEAVIKAFRALNRRPPYFLDHLTEKFFNLKLEEDRSKAKHLNAAIK